MSRRTLNPSLEMRQLRKFSPIANQIICAVVASRSITYRRPASKMLIRLDGDFMAISSPYVTSDAKTVSGYNGKSWRVMACVYARAIRHGVCTWQLPMWLREVAGRMTLEG